MKQQSIKEIVSEFLGFLKHKVDTDSMCMEDVKELARMIMGGMKVYGTAEDIAAFYGKPVDSVRHVISRRVIEKPKRRVLYPFGAVSRHAPSSWRDDTHKID